MRSPIRRPDLPRASSAISGFFFWGMIDEPVDHESCRVANPNSFDVHRHTSSPRRDKCTPMSAVTRETPRRSRGRDTASIEFAAAVANPSSAATASGSSASAEPDRAPGNQADSPKSACPSPSICPRHERTREHALRAHVRMTRAEHVADVYPGAAASTCAWAWDTNADCRSRTAGQSAVPGRASTTGDPSRSGRFGCARA